MALRADIVTALISAVALLLMSGSQAGSGISVGGPSVDGMCRNIRTLHNFEPPATNDEVQAAALQYVRKVGGSAKPSQANAAAYDVAVAEVAAATQRLLDSLVATTQPKDREEERVKARARSDARFARA